MVYKGNPIKMDDLGGTPILGNHHVTKWMLNKTYPVKWFRTLRWMFTNTPMDGQF